MSIKSTWYQLPEKDCERLTRAELGDVLRVLTLLSDAAHFQTDLARRLECIPNGKLRMRLCLGQLRAVTNDIIGTTPREQCKRIFSALNDNESRLVPKLTPGEKNVLVNKEQAKKLVDFARIKCRECVLDDEECRDCELYQLLLAVAPCDDYGHTYLCPYSRAEWED